MLSETVTAFSEMPETGIATKSKSKVVPCFHCGTECLAGSYATDSKSFCCDGCKLVYEILNNNGLCDYYKLQSHPGLKQIKAKRKDKWAYLDNEEIAQHLYSFSDGETTVVDLYLPGIHCSSCLWLLEHLNQVQVGIISSRVQFDKKRVSIKYARTKISLREIAELLDTIGYEPLINLEDASVTPKKTVVSKEKIIRLGLAGFCFGNIMMLSFPEYLGGEGVGSGFANFFRFIALGLSLPVVFYCAAPFFSSAWKGIKSRTLNIDAPIALAITITFSRSLYEILSGTGSGYLDSMSGIVFFMLVGRSVQERAWKSLSFHRDYKSYFPIAVEVLEDGIAGTRSLHELKRDDVVRVYNGEIIPADAQLMSGDALIDYSFVSGESDPVKVTEGSKLFAGGRQTAGAITMRVLKPVESSYLSALWSHQSFSKNKTEDADKKSMVHVLSRYFTGILMSLAAITALYWWAVNPANIIPAVSAMLIVACPCALLLSATFTNGAMLRALSDNGLYLRDPFVIETLSKIDHVVFDKTGTLTKGVRLQYAPGSASMTDAEKVSVYSVVSASSHPRSRGLKKFLGEQELYPVDNWQEQAGAGVSGEVDGHLIFVGNAAFTGGKSGADVYVRVDQRIFSFREIPVLRNGVAAMMQKLRARFACTLLSGDNARHASSIGEVFGNREALHFDKKPLEKLQYIASLQKDGHKVLMIGDGLNDAGALQQSNAGITLADDINNFTPSCDAILDAAQLDKLPALLRLARWGKTGIYLAFAISIVYNIVGLYFSVQAKLSPMIAAILMPTSTISIVIIGVGLTGWMAHLFIPSEKNK